ncbi:xanthine phosphoribosyltransferase [Candidatus Chloroploca mongolica]|uniref:xanthine phosphoribosyltransferase n=1 Tax=Candidatus Chloroploca mongolica TaxID=2528176 RepID=UPI0035314CBE
MDKDEILSELLVAPFLPLVERIIAEATVVNDRILKIDHFLNHRIEPQLMQAMGEAMAGRLRPFHPELILTAEASGIAPALATAMALGCPMVYAKKYSPEVEAPALSRIVPSPTKGGATRLVVSARYLPIGTRVALVDDFLANGRTAVALAELVREAGASLVAAGFVVEKLFQNGRAGIEALGIPVAALAQVERLEHGQVIVRGVATMT